jgi:hypothetical protein
MSLPGIISIPNGSVFLPGQLYNYIRSIIGSRLTGFWVGEDLVHDGTDILSWPGRLGGVLIVTSPGKFKTSSLNGRLAIIGTTGVRSNLIVDTGTPIKTVIGVAKVPPLPFANPGDGGQVFIEANSITPGAAIIGLSGVSALYTGELWSHYVNGVSTDNLTSDLISVLEGYRSANTTTYMQIGYGSGTYPWLAPQACAMSLSDLLTNNERILIIKALKEYYRII